MTAWKLGDWVAYRDMVLRVVPCPAPFADIDGPGKVWTVRPGEPDSRAQWLLPDRLSPASPEQVQAAQLAQLAGGGL